MVEFYKKTNSKDIFKYLLFLNLIGILFTVFLFGFQYLNAIYFTNLFVIFIVFYLYYVKKYYFVRWFWYFYSLFTLSAILFVSPVEMLNQNGLYYIFINIPEIILTTASIHKLLTEN